MGRVNLDMRKVYATAQKQTTPLVQKVTRQVLVGARRLAPRGDHKSGSGRRRGSQPLLLSLQASVDVGVNTIMGRVGATTNHAATAHQGSKPHIIRSKRGKLLKFQWERGNFLVQARRGKQRRFFYFEQVRHPGNKRPVRYLTTPLQMFGKAAGFRVTTLPVSRSRLP